MCFSRDFTLQRSKSRFAKAAGAKPARQVKDEELQAVVAPSTFANQNVQTTSCSEHFWKLRCGKSAHRCGAKHVLKSKVAKHVGFRPLLEVEILKKCTPLWREAYMEVRMYETRRSRTTFGSWDVQNTTCSGHLRTSRPWASNIDSNQYSFFQIDLGLKSMFWDWFYWFRNQYKKLRV